MISFLKWQWKHTSWAGKGFMIGASTFLAELLILTILVPFFGVSDLAFLILAPTIIITMVGSVLASFIEERYEAYLEDQDKLAATLRK